jgi:hypothetical protein
MRSYLQKTFDRTAALIVAFLMVAAIPLSFIVPPLQSPDETSHLKRAYLLSKGTVILGHLPKESSGGEIDTGLIRYMAEYKMNPPPKDRAPISADQISNANTIQWSGVSSYATAPGTGYYFPAMYAPL